MQKLNLPNYNFKITRKVEGDFIFDIVRKKAILLTPEEWVRQHIINYLHLDLGYPKGLLKVESGVMYNTRHKRSDIVIYNNSGSPYMLVECKAPSVKINQSTVEQVAMYNRTLHAPIIILTNGLVHYTFRVSKKGELENLNEIPNYKD
ncbi:MAG: type I restriction enzyme HsdR N-terminal domain-containing protein [Cyclobacteriaceae bacterium]|nr:type I restriction enzyme HsdR N-terminal domain-containing protein [Cyclobacteriaceae bacterium]